MVDIRFDPDIGELKNSPDFFKKVEPVNCLKYIV